MVARGGGDASSRDDRHYAGGAPHPNRIGKREAGGGQHQTRLLRQRLPLVQFQRRGSVLHLEDDDYWAQTFTATGIASADQFFVRLDYVSTLPVDKQISVYLVVNGVTLGELALGTRCCTGGIFYSGCPIAGPDYDVQMIVNHEVPRGEGGVSLNLNGRSLLRLRIQP
jgi:hypothetical protein